MISPGEEECSSNKVDIYFQFFVVVVLHCKSEEI